MQITERTTGRTYQLVKRFTPDGGYMEASTGRRYRLVKRYL